ncbi:sulfatase family protein [Calycomorphotria hydatis]|uniref:Arylsulfatase n=1 Tax=Calycomorphotria hydatis TaxID=2528027 RepID=A0A517TEX7_9PLAN|nr:sulfatase [Calycomorphotria hydatis]QDT66927.1 Arylsulfatase [Calycomorphotria hydatis]
MKFASLSVLVMLAFSAFAYAENRQPNIVMLISDDQAWTDYGFMDHSVIETPRLDQLAAESAVFPNGYVPDSLCRPSLVTMISGLYPHQHLVTGNDPLVEGGQRNYKAKAKIRNRMLKHIRRIPKTPAILGEHGYVSLQVGKWWEGNYSEGGFTSGMTHGDPQNGGRHGDLGLKIGREGIEPITTFLDENKGKPFYLWYAPFLPHTPHTPPQRLLDKYTSPGRPESIAKYYAMCEWFDETCGALLDAIEERGLSDNTIVMYVCDNGWITREDVSKYAPKSKRSRFDGGVRTPIMVKWPGQIKPAQYDTLVSSIDLVPTTLAACGISPTPEMHGVNLLDVIANNGACDRDTVFGAIYDHDVPDIDKAEPGLQHRWARRGDYKLILSKNPADPPELFNLKTDPFEEHNIAGDHPEVVEELTKAIEDWWQPAG